MLKVIGKRILVEPMTRSDLRAQDAAKRIPGFQIVSKNPENAPTQGKVYAVGKDITEVKVGDIVAFDQPLLQGFKHEGIGLIPVDIENVHAIIDLK